jgi:hypothetical protein
MTAPRNDFLFALLADGSSDRVLLPIISWCIRQLDPNAVLLPPHFRHRGSDEITHAVDELIATYRPNLVFVHRDAERLDHASRKREIPVIVGVVPVVPVRMTEAWLLTDEEAIRRASGNPNGRIPLDLPSTSRLENIADPKAELHRLLRTASELRGRRLQRLNESSAIHRVAETTEDFRLLRQLHAFVDLEDELRRAYPIARQAQARLSALP